MTDQPGRPSFAALLGAANTPPSDTTVHCGEVSQASAYCGPVSVHGPRRVPIVLTAPHEVTHQRLDPSGVLRDKADEPGTGDLAMALAGAVGGVAVVSRASRGDANVDEWHPLKDVAARYLAPGSYLLDLHGMGARHGLDVVLGAGALPDTSTMLLTSVADGLRAAGYRIEVHCGAGRFAARRPHTVTSWAQRRGAAAVQIEIAPDLRHRDRAAIGRFRDVMSSVLGALPVGADNRTGAV